MIAQFDNERLIIDIRKFIIDNHITARDFCRLSEMDDANLSRFLSGKKRSLSEQTVSRIASLLGSSADNYKAIQCKSYESMTVEELTALLEQIREIRDRKIDRELADLREKTELYEKELPLLRDKTELYEKLLKESED